MKALLEELAVVARDQRELHAVDPWERLTLGALEDDEAQALEQLAAANEEAAALFKRCAPLGADHRKRFVQAIAKVFPMRLESAPAAPRGVALPSRATKAAPRPWFRGAWPRYGMLIAAVLAGGIVVAAVVPKLDATSGRIGSKIDTVAPVPSPASTAVSSSGAIGLAPAAAAGESVLAEPALRALLAVIQGVDAEKASPQLRELLEVQGRLAVAWQDDSRTSDDWTLQALQAAARPFTPGAARESFLRSRTGPDISMAPPSIAQPPASATPQPAWPHALRIPAGLSLVDGSAVHVLFEYDTKNAAGRSAFQRTLDECSAYEDIFDGALQRYGAPRWLTAVVFQESGCDRRAQSSIGRAGLWQLTLECARAYGLRVSDGQLDQRLNVIQSTDAAIHFLTDLERALGAWDLALAAYRIGPLALLTRMSHTHGHPGLRELVRAGLRDETAAYVVAIDAYALALENRRALDFVDHGKGREHTAEIVAPTGTRLSVIARAASTSTDRIRDLNPQFLGNVVPDGETRVQVPAGDGRRAQALLDSRDPGDRTDTCVPPEFDWGSQSFTASPYAKVCPAGDQSFLRARE